MTQIVKFNQLPQQQFFKEEKSEGYTSFKKKCYFCDFCRCLTSKSDKKKFLLRDNRYDTVIGVIPPIKVAIQHTQ